MHLNCFAVSDTSVVEGESQIQMGRFISFLQAWSFWIVTDNIYIYLSDRCFIWLYVTGAVLLCVTLLWSGGQHGSPAGCFVQQQQVRLLKHSHIMWMVVWLQCFYLFIYFFVCLRSATKIIESTGVHFQVIHVLFIWFFTATWRLVLMVSLCSQSDSVRASGRTSGGPHHPGWDHGEPRHTERSLEDV